MSIKFNILLISLIITLPFLSASDSFSYDYQFYRMYFEEISASSIDVLSTKTIGAYVFLNYSSGIEIGFVALTKFISFFVSDPVIIYASIVCICTYIKIYSLIKLDVSFWLIGLIVVYSLILLEGNALRSGLALSVILFSIYLQTIGKIYISIFLGFLALLIHLQSFVFISLMLFYNIFNFNKYIGIKKTYFILFIISIFSGLLLDKVLNYIGLFVGKIDDYTSKEANAGGINILSLLSIFSVLWSFYFINSNFKRFVSDDFKKYCLFIFLICTFTLSIYVFFTKVSVVGDRLWQWGLVVMTAVYSFCRNNTFNAKLNKGELLLGLTLSFVIFNTTIRYPLTNIFYPLLPYVDLSKGF